MSMPIITGSDVSREQSVADMIESIALQKTGLSHVFNTQGETIQAFEQMPDSTLEDFYAVNRSVENMVDAINTLETILYNKLKLFRSFLQPIIFSFNKVDSVTGDPVEGAGFTLTQGTTVIDVATSDTEGLVAFSNLLPGTYSFTETLTPVGYGPNPETYTLVVTDRNNITINGTPAEDFTIANVPILE